MTAASSPLKNACAMHQPSRTPWTEGDTATTRTPREPPRSPTIIHGRRMPRREVVRSLSLPNTGLATKATNAPVPTTRDSFPGAASAPTRSSIFSARVTSRGAISIRLVLANARA